jgi:hypothetical protein
VFKKTLWKCYHIRLGDSGKIHYYGTKIPLLSKKQAVLNMRMGYQLLRDHAPSNISRKYPYPSEYKNLSETKTHMLELWKALNEWFVDCDICGRFKRKIKAHEMNPVKAREHPIRHFLIKSKRGHHCHDCTLIFVCLQAYYESFEIERENFVVGIYPAGEHVLLLVRKLKTTSWVDCTKWFQIFPGK